MWYDIDINFTKSNSGDLKHDEGIRAIENSIRNIFRTRISSRRMLYPFASPAYGILFEPIDHPTAERIGYTLLDAIESWETRIRAVDITVIPLADENRYDVSLRYEILNEGNVRYTYTDILKAI